MTVPVLPSAFAVSATPWREKRTGAWRPGLAAACRHAEVFAYTNEAGGAGAALALALDGLGALDSSAATPDERPWLWVQDRTSLRLSGRPYLPGLPPPLRHRLIHVAAPSPEDALFALEEGLRCRDLAFVLGEIAGNPRALDFTASRRLSLAAEKHGLPLWLVRLDAARDLGSARMRWEVRSAPSLPPRWNPEAPGAAAWEGELFRAHVFQPGRWVLRDEGRLVAELPSRSQEGLGEGSSQASAGSARASTGSARAESGSESLTASGTRQTPLSLSLSKAAR